MKMTNWVKLTLTAAAAMTLAACSSGAKMPNQFSSVPANNYLKQANSNAKTYAMKGQDPYSQMGWKKFVNSQVAPSMQVYYFAFDKSQVARNYMRDIQAQASYLIKHPNAKIRLEGNTDNRGSREYNVALGSRRDVSVAAIFENLGVRPSQIAQVSYGEERPAVRGNSQTAWALNRRVVLEYEAR